jgi:hypothetical protein
MSWLVCSPPQILIDFLQYYLLRLHSIRKKKKQRKRKHEGDCFTALHLSAFRSSKALTSLPVDTKTSSRSALQLRNLENNTTMDDNQDAKKRAAPAASPAAPPAKKPQATALQQQIQQQLQQQLQAQLQAAAARGQQANITPEQIQVRPSRKNNSSAIAER